MMFCKIFQDLLFIFYMGSLISFILQFVQPPGTNKKRVQVEPTTAKPVSRVDLHVHSAASFDGKHLPEEIVAKCVQNGVKVLSLTDHNTIDNLKVTAMLCEQTNITFIPGIELNVCIDQQHTIHYLMYFPTYFLDNQMFQHDLTNLLDSMRDRMKLAASRIAMINEHFYGFWAKTKCLLSRPLTIDLIIMSTQDKFAKLNSIKTTLERMGLDENHINIILSHKSPARVRFGISANELAKFFQKYPKIVGVWAHPGAINGHDSLPADTQQIAFERNLSLFPRVQNALCPDGIEIYHPCHNHQQKRILLDLAHKYDLLITGGSDFHDVDKRAAFGISELDAKDIKRFLNRLS